MRGLCSAFYAAIDDENSDDRDVLAMSLVVLDRIMPCYHAVCLIEGINDHGRLDGIIERLWRVVTEGVIISRNEIETTLNFVLEEVYVDHDSGSVLSSPSAKSVATILYILKSILESDRQLLKHCAFDMLEASLDYVYATCGASSDRNITSERLLEMYEWVVESPFFQVEAEFIRQVPSMVLSYKADNYAALYKNRPSVSSGGISPFGRYIAKRQRGAV